MSKTQLTSLGNQIYTLAGRRNVFLADTCSARGKARGVEQYSYGHRRESVKKRSYLQEETSMFD